MCRMIGAVFVADFPTDFLTDLRQVAKLGKIPGEDKIGHGDGWGIVSYMRGMPFYVDRRLDPIFDDPHFEPAVQQISKLERPNIVIAHARASSGTPASIVNTHPFVSDNIVLAHNGTVYDFDPHTTSRPAGDTDSELLLLKLADRYREGGSLKAALKSLITEDIGRNEFSAAVLLVSDGRQLFGYRDYSKGRSPGYYDLRIATTTTSVVLYQETHQTSIPVSIGVAKGELVTVGKDLAIEREKVR